MRNSFFDLMPTYRQWFYAIAFILSMCNTGTAMAQETEKGNKATEELVNMGFENVRCIENDEERIYTIENSV